MPTYYEILEIQPNASSKEIHAALDEQYNQWRRLVTHHVPEKAMEANRAIQTLETIRSTLTDPAKRSVYDAAIGVSGPVGGIADPELTFKTLVQQYVPTPHTPTLAPVQNLRTLSQPQEQTQPFRPVLRSDIWLCQKCNSANTTGALFCESCGNRIGIICPRCGKITELAKTFCPACGADKKSETNKLEGEIEDIRSQISAIEKEIQCIEKVPVLPLLKASFSRFTNQEIEIATSLREEVKKQHKPINSTNLKAAAVKIATEKRSRISLLEQQIGSLQARLNP